MYVKSDSNVEHCNIIIVKTLRENEKKWLMIC